LGAAADEGRADGDEPKFYADHELLFRAHKAADGGPPPAEGADAGASHRSW